MSWKYTYDDLLERAYSQLPEVREYSERFNIPVPEIVYEGKNTVVRNYKDICKTINRDPRQVLQVMLREIGTAGEIHGEMLILQGRISSNKIIDALESYVLSYVICSECGSPDTELIKQERNLMLKCHACGAIRPIGLAKIKLKENPQMFVLIVKEGREYDVIIEGTTPEGHGVAKLRNYTIVVPGTKPGDRVKVRVLRVDRNTAYAEVISREILEK
ncbi:MAG: translation initiation factor IF-2 subunit beta [Thermoplasmata archaeon]|nr:translation initiation factor IF-2 subunit beta [Euryarchaeota archaeon]RLF67264.1 MAG: translation initiation factor IF-2 subunit beta [Thermoplasmata archaeon]